MSLDKKLQPALEVVKSGWWADLDKKPFEGEVYNASSINNTVF
ncbi:MAG: hypothetical protein AB9856_03000 [Cellulosilyticaceae bacterium]